MHNIALPEIWKYIYDRWINRSLENHYCIYLWIFWLEFYVFENISLIQLSELLCMETGQWTREIHEQPQVAGDLVTTMRWTWVHSDCMGERLHGLSTATERWTTGAEAPSHCTRLRLNKPMCISYVPKMKPVNEYRTHDSLCGVLERRWCRKNWVKQ